MAGVQKISQDFVRELDRTGILNQGREREFQTQILFGITLLHFYLHESRGDIKELNDLIVNTYFDDIWSEGLILLHRPTGEKLVKLY